MQFASWIWFFSLRQLQELCDIWLAQPANIQQAIQDEVSSRTVPQKSGSRMTDLAVEMLRILVRCSSTSEIDEGRNGTASGHFETVGGFCADTTFAAAQPGCMTISTSMTGFQDTPLTDVVTSAHSPGTDYTLNNIFTCLYGWTAVLGAFLLATLCVIKEVSLQHVQPG